jgi:hypothetical protein
MPTSKPGVVEIAIDTPTNGSLHFRPLNMRVRGAFEYRRIKEPLAMQKANAWPAKIPGQRLGIEIDPATGVVTGYIAEPLAAPEFELTREQIKTKLRQQVGPARQDFANVHAPSWLHFMKSAVAGGLATVTAGELPEDIGGEPQTDFITKRKPSAVERLAVALEKQTEVFTALLNKLSNSK